MNITYGNLNPSSSLQHRPSFFSHYRNYEEEKKNGFISGSNTPHLLSSAYSQPMSTYGVLSAGFYAGMGGLKQRSFKGIYSGFNVDNAFGAIRMLENQLPLFKIPLRASQAGDFLSPFVSSKSINWQYSGKELLTKQGSLKEEFAFLNERFGRDITPDLANYDTRLSFNKTGRVYGNLEFENLSLGTKAQVNDLFMMQRPSTKGSAISTIFDPGSRPVSFYNKLGDDSLLIKGAKKFGLSASRIESLRYSGGVVKTIGQEAIFEAVKGMNRFLKEPVPILNTLLALPDKSKTLGGVAGELGASGAALGAMFKTYGNVPVQSSIPWGRLPQLLRPYVEESSTSKMLLGMAAKGSIYTKVLPSLYLGLDYTRRQMEDTNPLLRGGIFGAIGLGVGSLIKSGGATSLGGVLTKTQLAGLGIGAAVGVMPSFNKGITSGFASLYSNLRIKAAQGWNAVGGQDAVERQEGLFPGITNPFTGVGFTMSGGFIGYFNSEMGTARGIAGVKNKEWSSFVKDGLKQFEAVTSSGTLGLKNEELLHRFAEFYRTEQKGASAGIAEAVAIFQGKLKPHEVKTTTGFLAAATNVGKEGFGIEKEFFNRSKTTDGAQQLASRLSNHLSSFMESYFEENRFVKNIGESRISKARNLIKDTLMGPKGFKRGAARGALAFMGIAQIGAIAAGPLGGNFSPVDLLPGWLIRLTGGGKSAKETEEVFTGKKEVAIRKARWWSLGSTPFEGCLLPNTFVNINNDQSKQAKDISKEDKLINLYGEKVDIKEISIREAIGEDIYRIQTYYNSDSELVVTGNHPILVSNDKQGKSLCWKEAREVLSSDLVFIPQIKHEIQISFIDIDQWLKQFYEFEDNTWYTKRVAPTKYTPDMINEILYWGSLKPKSTERNKQLSYMQDKYSFTYNEAKYILNDLRKGRLKQRRKIKGVRSRRILLNQDFGRLIGYYAAEGSIASNGVSFSFHSEEDKYHQDVKNLFEKIFGLDTCVYQVCENGVSITVNSKIIQDLFQTLVSGTARAGTKQLNPLLLDAPEEFLLGFMDGFIKGDGSVQNSNSVRIGLHPSHLIEQLQLILNKLGIISSIKKQVKISGGYILQNLYIPALASYQLNQLIEIKELPLNSISKPKKNYHCFKIDEGFLVKITKLEQDFYSGYVYDFEVSEGSSFLTPQCIVHNSKVSYFRKHRAVIAQTDAKDNALYGSTEERLAYDPILHPLKAIFDDEFKYHRDLRLSKISPTPLSSRMFSDVPILGDVLAGTIGEIVKPTMMIRPDEWLKQKQNLLTGLVSAVNVAPTPGSDQFQAMRQAPAIAALGGNTNATAEFQGSIAASFGNTFKRFSEQAGLRGFMASTLLESVGIGGRSYDPVLESGDSLLGSRNQFWSMNLGDPFGMTEGIRRYLTRDRNSYYNPLTNMAPSWLPENEYFLDFKHGNYFNKVQEGWLRLPGAGYETLNPEVRGLNPENYSLGHKYKILTDVAYGSDEFISMKQEIKNALQAGKLSQRDKELISEANEQVEERRMKKVFRGYQFRENTKDISLTISGVLDDGTFTAIETGSRKLKLGGVNTTMAALVREQLKRENFSTIAAAEKAAQERQSEIISTMKGSLSIGSKINAKILANENQAMSGSFTEVEVSGLNKKILSLGAEANKDSELSHVRYNKAQKLLGSIWEQYTHKWADAPLTPAMLVNRLAPFQPDKKFIQRLSPLELYKQTRVYGKEIQMWQRYKQDFFEPFVNQSMAKVFGDFVPKETQYRRTIVEYFDKLKWMKYYSYEQAAKKAGNQEIASIYAEKKRQTLFGANAYRGYLDVYRALPGTERDFYREFANEQNEEERSKILEMVPEYMKHIYIAQWQNKDIEALSNKIDAGIATSNEKRELRQLYNLRAVEGMNWNSQLDSLYKNETRGQDISYADWARMQELKEYFKSFKLPRGNFVGWDPRVSLEDIKLQVAKQEGIDIHDIGLWDSQEATIKNKPYVESAAEEIKDWSVGTENGIDLETRIRSQMAEFSSKISLIPLPAGMRNRMVIRTMDTREHEIRATLQGRGVI